MMHSIGRSRNIGRIPSQAIIGIENVHSNMEKKDSMRGKKHCKPSKRLPTVTSCDRECGDIVNRELPFYKICLERGRYRVGPFVTPRPFGVQEERLINFCMDETLNEGEIVFRTNFNEITRNDIMSMSPRSIINLKVVSAVAEMLSVQGTIKVGERKFSLFMPAYNTIFVPVYCGHARWYMLVLVTSEKRVEIWDPLPSAMSMDYNIALCKRVLTSIDTTLDHGGSNVDCNSIKLRDFPIEFCSREPTIRNEYDCALYIMLMMDRHNMLSSLNSLCQFHSDAERVRIVIKLITCSFNFLKDNIASSSEIHQRRIDVAEQSFCKAIDKRRLRQLRRSRQMGHGPRH
ncbi:uncharacterized protein LOC102618161 isoform X5 [Citrus sinensis]|uniref:uncharacterized protein LOC102618161 isoform X5 n=1 Tax=Citrus sinensis TaxID=2711 RepID=UPI002277B45B|nr:uncharacterized protein LOC102618161 isoform X5 [Citrus sinensis]